MSRKEDLFHIRPELDLPSLPDMSSAETLQNKVLRPLLKLQNELLVKRFSIDPFTLKSGFEKFDNSRKQDYIEKRLKTDKKLQKEMIGMVSGLLTLEEFDQYWTEKHELNRRLLNMLAKRLYDGLKNAEPVAF